MATDDYYETLGVPSNASEDAIKKAYRKLAREFHPDHHQGPGKDAAETRFKSISAAYDTLGDPEKRKAYDQMRQFGPAFQGQTGPFARGRRGFQQTAGFGAGGLDDLFATMFGGAQAQSARGATDPMPEVSVEITLQEAYQGVARELPNPRTGKRLRVKIPPGVATGSKVRAGEVVVSVSVLPHAWFEREGDDLSLALPLTFWEAIEGAELEVPTMTGAVKMKIPPRTQTGRTFRLKGKGMPHLKGEGHGDLFVKAEIHLPTELDEQSLALFRRLASMTPYDPRAARRMPTD